MSFLTGWISNIIIFVLLAIVIDMLLPSSSFQKYTKMVIGILLIAIIIAPILRLFQTNFDESLVSSMMHFNQNEENKLGNLTESKKKEIQAVQSAYILEQLAHQLKGDVEEELMKKYKMEVDITHIAVKNEENPKLPDDLESITISLKEKKDKNDPVEAIARININTKEEMQTNETDYSQIKNFLAKAWSVDVGKIQIDGERRNFTLER